MIESHLYATGVWAALSLLSILFALWVVTHPRSPPKFPINKTGAYTRSKNFER